MHAPSAIPQVTRPGALRFPPAGKRLSAFRSALLHWYDLHQRDLPWRKTRDPYRIWLSEIMLQQTRVTAVLEHYRLFLERFPTVEALAAASEDSVLAAWSGLGYYRRARMLHQCAKELVTKHGGRFPQCAEALQALPGIGRYTAAAIASIAFNEPIAVVDGNVERVVQRLQGRDLSPAQLWRLAQSLLSTSHAADFNQAMMELGATLCLPRDPKCPDCPVRRWCATGKEPQSKVERRASSPGETAIRISSHQIKKEIWCALNQRDHHVELVQRHKKSALMPGMWELPLLERPPGLPISSHWRTFRHSITVTNYTVHVRRSSKPSVRGKWIPVADIAALPLTGLTRKILKAASII